MRPLFFLEDFPLKKNLLVLALVAIVCALGAQFLRGGGQSKDWTALRVDMVDALERFWNTRGHQVELLPNEKGVNASAMVVLPQGCSPRQQQWNYPLLRYVAQRNATPVLHSLSLTTSLGPLPETASQAETQGAVPQQPYASGGSIDTHLELVRRQAQAWLDSVVGSGNALALVDGDSRQVSLPQAPGSQNHYMRARDRSESARARRSTNEVAPQPIMLNEYTTVLVLVINGRAEGAEAKLSRLPELEQSLQLKLDGRDSRRVVVLP